MDIKLKVKQYEILDLLKLLGCNNIIKSQKGAKSQLLSCKNRVICNILD